MKRDPAELQKEILALKEQTGATILAHNYVDGAIQDIADFCGDSLELSVKAKKYRADLMVFCGVRFMAETAIQALVKAAYTRCSIFLHVFTL